MNLDEIPFIQAKNYTKCALPRAVNLIVIHTTENQPRSGVARAVSLWFAGASAPEASAHYVVDDSETICCVKPGDIAWGAPGANRDGVHVEHVGLAAWTAEDWDSDFARSMLWNSAKLVAELCRVYAVPVVKVKPLPGARGLCGHVDVTQWRNGGKGHTDPGMSFPWNAYVGLVNTMMCQDPTDAA